MREIKAEIQISAAPAKVWEVLSDFNSWKTWNPIVNQVSGQGAQGAKLKVTMQGKDGQAGGIYEPLVINFDAPLYFRWRAHMMAGFLFTNDKIFELKEINGHTHLVQKETFSGLLVPLFWGKLEKWVPGMLDSMNKALKKKIEGQ